MTLSAKHAHKADLNTLSHDDLRALAKSLQVSVRAQAEIADQLARQEDVVRHAQNVVLPAYAVMLAQVAERAGLDAEPIIVTVCQAIMNGTFEHVHNLRVHHALAFDEEPISVTAAIAPPQDLIDVMAGVHAIVQTTPKMASVAPFIQAFFQGLPAALAYAAHTGVATDAPRVEPTPVEDARLATTGKARLAVLAEVVGSAAQSYGFDVQNLRMDLIASAYRGQAADAALMALLARGLDSDAIIAADTTPASTDLA